MTKLLKAIKHRKTKNSLDKTLEHVAMGFKLQGLWLNLKF